LHFSGGNAGTAKQRQRSRSQSRSADGIDLRSYRSRAIRSSAPLNFSGVFFYASYRCTFSRCLAHVGTFKDDVVMVADGRRSSMMLDKWRVSAKDIHPPMLRLDLSEDVTRRAQHETVPEIYAHKVHSCDMSRRSEGKALQGNIAIRPRSRCLSAPIGGRCFPHSVSCTVHD
ncbi:hypothetical protein, partial [Burkholderia pyrrocinia]|uniref:hypothetical protein n=1 Tax=Burkholderia pyrrocinia TaxID=60550 RepID=UPI001A9E594C